MRDLLTLLSVGLLFAQIAGSSLADPSATLSPAVEAKIRSLEDEEHHAVLATDVPTLERLWSTDIIVNNPQSRITPNREALLERVREGKIHYSSFERRIEAMRASGDDLVIVMGAEEVVPASPAPNTGKTVLRRFTDLWKKKDDTWTLIARHANVVPGASP